MAGRKVDNKLKYQRPILSDVNRCRNLRGTWSRSKTVENAGRTYTQGTRLITNRRATKLLPLEQSATSLVVQLLPSDEDTNIAKRDKQGLRTKLRVVTRRSAVAQETQL